MTRLQKGLLIGAVIFLLLTGACSAVFYFAVYRPIGSPMMAMATSYSLDERLTTKDFVRPGSGEVTAEQLRRFMAVEEVVEKIVGTDRALLADQQSVLEKADKAGEISFDTALAAFGAIKPMLMGAKPKQVEAMNTEHFSKKEFEWVRDQLYRAAGVPLSRVDVSDFFTGTENPAVSVRELSAQEANAANLALARPIAAKLEAWRAFAFFGL
jgi:hypothetical protein